MILSSPGSVWKLTVVRWTAVDRGRDKRAFQDPFGLEITVVCGASPVREVGSL